jgi:ABC-2 type transport system permease protein
VAACVVLASLPSMVVPWVLSDADITAGVAARGLLAMASVLFVALVHAALAVSLSCWSRDSRISLLLALAFWVLSALVLPRMASELTVRRIPTPDPGTFWAAISKEVKDGLPGEPSPAERLKVFERETLRAHGVTRPEDLPVGYLALRRLFRDAQADRVHDRHFDRLWRTYHQQQRVVWMASGASPTVAWRAVSMALAGTDLAHEERFQEAAERYRRDVNTLIDRWDAAHSRGLASYEERYAGDALWEAMPQFAHEGSDLPTALSGARTPLLILLAWAGLALALLGVSARRLKP